MVTITDIREKLSEAIKQSGLSQSEIARRIGVKHSQVYCYVHCQKLPALDTLAKLCAVLDLDANEILCVSEFREQ